jgi:mRNA-degrading endonuclease RelE of RelBE toxin-antitoxin system
VRFEILLSPQAIAQRRSLPAPVRSQVREALETHLRYEPTKVSRSRIKRLRDMACPQYRLRVDEIRVFYDVTEDRVEVLAIVTKAQAESWLREQGTPAPTGGAGGGEG